MEQYNRGEQILRLLYEHGPLSSNALGVLLEPKINKRRLREALQRLYEKHIVYKRRPTLMGEGPVFYQIDRHSSARRKAAKMLHDPGLSTLRQPQFRWVVPYHSESCALWRARLMRLFPGSLVLRRFESGADPEARSLIFDDGSGGRNLPDLLFLSAPDERGRRVSIAIELEFYFTRDTHFKYKLSQHARKGGLDGVLIVSGDHLQPWYERVYTQKYIRNAQRIKHRENLFWMFSDDFHPTHLNDIEVVSLQREVISLSRWIEACRRIKDIEEGEGRLKKVMVPRLVKVTED